MQTNLSFGLPLKEFQTARFYFSYRNFLIHEITHFLDAVDCNTREFSLLKKIYKIHRFASLSAIEFLIYHSSDYIEAIIDDQNIAVKNHYNNKVKPLIANAILSKEIGARSLE